MVEQCVNCGTDEDLNQEHGLTFCSECFEDINWIHETIIERRKEEARNEERKEDRHA